MPKAIHAESEAINADSFLDIVASVVSIMIIMVLMVGLRIRKRAGRVAARSSRGASLGRSRRGRSHRTVAAQGRAENGR